MLGMFNLLPLVKGWQYKTHSYEKTVDRGGISQPWRIPEMGWILSVYFGSTDAYGTLRIEYQDADLETHSAEINAELVRAGGAVQQDPSGWVQRYFRPNPLSTSGYYLTVWFSAGYQGSAWPFVPTTTVSLILKPESTQQSAIISAIAATVAITNRELFVQSLRQVLNSEADIQVPKQLLSIGPIPLVQQPNKTDDLLEQILTELKQRK